MEPPTDGPRVSMISLSLVAESRKAGPIELDLTNPEKLKDLKKNRGLGLD